MRRSYMSPSDTTETHGSLRYEGDTWVPQMRRRHMQQNLVFVQLLTWSSLLADIVTPVSFSADMRPQLQRPVRCSQCADLSWSDQWLHFNYSRLRTRMTSLEPANNVV